MASLDEMREMILQNPLVDVIMKCGQVVCGQVADLDGEFMVVNEPDRSASCWIRQEEVAFIRLHPPLEQVRYPDDPRQQQQQQQQPGYGAAYMPTVFDDPDPQMPQQPQPPSPYQQPMQRQPGRVVVAPDARARLEQVKQRHRTAEFVSRRSQQDAEFATGPQMERQHVPQPPPQKRSSDQVYRPAIDNREDEEPQQ